MRYVVRDGVCHWETVVGQSSPVFTLPAGMRPALEHHFSGIGADSTAERVTVSPDGRIRLSSEGIEGDVFVSGSFPID